MLNENVGQLRPPTDQSADGRRSQPKVGRLHVRIARQRANDLHSFTRRPAGEHPVIILETLTTKNLMADRRIAAAIADQGWGELARQLTYKTAWAGGTLLAAPRFLPSSNACATYGRERSTGPDRILRVPCLWRMGDSRLGGDAADCGAVRRHTNQPAANRCVGT